jgi:hypothetical protein
VSQDNGNPASDPAASTTATFYNTTLFLVSAVPRDVTLRVAADSVAFVYLNGDYTTISFYNSSGADLAPAELLLLKPGRNTISILVVNQPLPTVGVANPTGLLASVTLRSQVLSRTGNHLDWVMSTGHTVPCECMARQMYAPRAYLHSTYWLVIMWVNKSNCCVKLIS